MPTPLRLLRAEVQIHDRAPPIPTPRQRERESRILHLGEILFASFGRHTITLASFAQALHLSRDAIRWHFADLDDLLATLIRRHLRAVANILGDIPRATPDCAARRRAAYLAATRTGLGAFTPAHLLLTRDRAKLPADLLDSIETTYRELGSILAGPTRQAHAAQILALLDTPDLAAADIEHQIAALPEINVAPPAEARPAAAKPRPFIWTAEPPPPNIPFTLPPEKLAGLLQFAQPRSRAALKTSTSPPPARMPATKRFGT